MATVSQALEISNKLVSLSKGFEYARDSAKLMNDTLEQMNVSISESCDVQGELNVKVKDAEKSAGILENAFKGVADAIKNMKMPDWMSDLAGKADEMTRNNKSLDVVNDKLQTTDELKKKIYGSANRSQSSYEDTASMVIDFERMPNNVFDTNDQTIAFVETLQKMTSNAGLSAEDSKDVIGQVYESMKSGTMSSDDYADISSKVPAFASAAGSEPGKEVSSANIGSSVLGMRDEIDKAFNDSPATWAGIWIEMMNSIMLASQPLLEFVSLLAENFDLLEPIILAVAAAVGVYELATLAGSIAQKISTVSLNGLNAAFMANPIMWIIMAVIALVGIFYAVIEAINKVTGSSMNATGMIIGAFSVVVAAVYNMIMGVIQIGIGLLESIVGIFIAIANIVENIFNDPIGTVINLFADLVDIVLGFLEKIATGIDFIFGSNFAETVGTWRKDIADIAKDQEEKYGNGKYEKIAKNIDINEIAGEMGLSLGGKGYTDSYDKYSEMGPEVDDKISKLFKGSDLGDLGELTEPGKDDKTNQWLDELNSGNAGMMAGFGEQAPPADYADAFGEKEFDVNVDQDVNLADESLKYLLDAVTQKYTNTVNLQAPAPNMTVQFMGNIDQNTDIDSLAAEAQKQFGRGLVEYMVSSTEASYA